jgi:cytochrome c-type biogenesis protein
MSGPCSSGPPLLLAGPPVKEARFQIKDKRFGYVGALLIGAAFAFGWTPCIGPILGGILTFAGTLENVNQGVLLLLMYSLGLGIPFLSWSF